MVQPRKKPRKRLSASRQTKHAASYKAILQAGHWFANLDASLQDELLAAASVRKLSAKERLFARGDAPDGLYALVDGALRVTGVGPDGREAMLTRFEPPSWFGEISIFDGLPRTHDTIADGACTLVFVETRKLQAVLDREPKRWIELGRLCAQKLRLTFEALEDMAILPLDQRLARRLLLMAHRHGEWKDKSSRVIAVSQEQLALMLGATRQTVNQLLRELEGVVRVAYGAIEILDLARLRAAAKLDTVARRGSVFG